MGLIDGKYYHHLNESPSMKETVLSEKESWKLCDLMETYCTLKKTAEIYHTGNAHLTSTGQEEQLKNPEAEKRINEIEMPMIFKAIYELLSPTVEEVK